MLDPHPGQNEKTLLVGDPLQALPPLGPRSPDEVIARGHILRPPGLIAPLPPFSQGAEHCSPRRTWGRSSLVMYSAFTSALNVSLGSMSREPRIDVFSKFSRALPVFASSRLPSLSW